MNLTLITVMIMQHVILLSPTNTTALVMMALLEMVCFVKVSIEYIGNGIGGAKFSLSLHRIVVFLHTN